MIRYDAVDLAALSTLVDQSLQGAQSDYNRLDALSTLTAEEKTRNLRFARLCAPSKENKKRLINFNR